MDGWKLLMVGDDPNRPTGFARVVQNLARRWAAAPAMTNDKNPNDKENHSERAGFLFERIDIWAINYFGYPGRPGEPLSEWQRPPFRLYPANLGDRWYAPENLQALVEHVQAGDYTHLWMMQDHFLLSRHNFPRSLWTAARKKGVKIYYYAPIDGRMQRPWVEVARYADWPVAYTEYGRRQLDYLLQQPLPIVGRDGKLSGRTTLNYPPVAVLPHGADALVFRPVVREEGASGERIEDGKLQIENCKSEGGGNNHRGTEGTENGVGTEIENRESRIENLKLGGEKTRAELRAEFLEAGELLAPGDILLLNVNMNQRRKDCVRTLEVLQALRRRPGGEKYKLLMHMNPVSAGDGIDLTLVSEQIGLKVGHEWGHTEGLFEGQFGQLTEAQLNELYNCADGYLTTSLGEGWGFGMTEALAAGLPVFAPDHTACAELSHKIDAIGDGEIVLRLPLETGALVQGSDNCVVRHRVDVAGAAASIDLYFEAKAALGTVGVSFGGPSGDGGIENRELRIENLESEGDGINHGGTENTEKGVGAEIENRELRIENFKSWNRAVERSGLSAAVREWLSWDRIAREWIRLFERPARLTGWDAVHLTMIGREGALIESESEGDEGINHRDTESAEVLPGGIENRESRIENLKSRAMLRARYLGRFWLYIEEEDRAFTPHWRSGIWEAGLTKWMIGNLTGGNGGNDEGVDLFLDIGSNVGYYAMLALSLGIKTVAFEPQKRLRRLIAKSAEVNGFMVGDFGLVGCALWNRNESGEMVIPTGHSGGAFKDRGSKPHVDEFVKEATEFRRFDDWWKEFVTARSVSAPADALKKRRKVVVKIDAEGAEPEILEGMPEFLKANEVTLVLEWDARRWKERVASGEGRVGSGEDRIENRESRIENLKLGSEDAQSEEVTERCELCAVGQVHDECEMVPVKPAGIPKALWFARRLRALADGGRLFVVNDQTGAEDEVTPEALAGREDLIMVGLRVGVESGGMGIEN